MILLSSAYTLTKSPFPIPSAFAKDFGRTIEKDDSPTSPWTFLNSLVWNFSKYFIDYIKKPRYKEAWPEKGEICPRNIQMSIAF